MLVLLDKRQSDDNDASDLDDDGTPPWAGAIAPRVGNGECEDSDKIDEEDRGDVSEEVGEEEDEATASEPLLLDGARAIELAAPRADEALEPCAKKQRMIRTQKASDTFAGQCLAWRPAMRYGQRSYWFCICNYHTFSPQILFPCAKFVQRRRSASSKEKGAAMVIECM